MAVSQHNEPTEEIPAPQEHPAGSVAEVSFSPVYAPEDLPQVLAATESSGEARNNLEGKKPPRRWLSFARTVGAAALGAALFAHPAVKEEATDMLLGATAGYSSFAGEHSLPGSGLYDGMQQMQASKLENAEVKTRQNIIEMNDASPITTFQTKSGITLEVMQAGLGDNPEKPLTVDEEVLEMHLDFIIKNLHELDQDEVSAAAIQKFQERAAAGELDNLTMTLVTSTDPDHCLNEDGKQFKDIFGTDECAANGETISHTSSLLQIERGLNPTLLVGSARHVFIMRNPSESDEGNTDGDLLRSLNRTPVDLRNMPGEYMMSIINLHEMAHGVVFAIKPDMSKDAQHHEFVDPITEAATSLIFGFAGDREKMPLPFSISDLSDQGKTQE